MHVQVYRLWPRRPRDGSLPLGLSCDEEGLLLGGICRLITPTLDALGQKFYRVRPLAEINAVLSAGYGGHVDVSNAYPAFERLARHMSRGEWTAATLTALHLRLPELPDASAARRILDAEEMVKVWNPDLHPRWPAHSDEGHGGEFRPAAGSADDKEKQRRLEQRRRDRALFKLLRRVLRFVPGGRVIDAIMQIAQVIQILRALNDISPELRRSVEEPKDIEDLRADKQFRSFPSFQAFKDFYGPAGEGYEWHHIVEQSADFPPEQVNTTENIIRIPKFIHEEIGAIYSNEIVEGSGITFRDVFHEMSFAEQRAVGKIFLRDLGVTK